MPIYSAQVTLNHDSALSEDVTVNTFHVSGDLGSAAADVATALWNFYTGAATGQTNTIFARFSSKLAGTGRIRLYNLADAKPRVPILDVEKSGGITHNTALPGEVAACLSWKAEAASGVNAKRRRNRIYLGPLAQSVQAAADNPTIVAGFRTDALVALEALRDSIEGVTGGLATLVGYSPTDGVPWPIHTAWMDDAFDTQRRRGGAPVTRSTRVFA